MDGRNAARVATENSFVANAWMTEALRRTKRLPPLKSLLSTLYDDQNKEQSPDDMVSVLQALKAGGADIDLKFIPHGENDDEEA